MSKKWLNYNLLILSYILITENTTTDLSIHVYINLRVTARDFIQLQLKKPVELNYGYTNTPSSVRS